ncbi:MAG: sensor histidine kinase [Undibacterium curvum]|uniref:sensor histidine kinase n=1 Tax=Undibacterium curvum TaxID=2762294 RepID=UPI003BE3A267
MFLLLFILSSLTLSAQAQSAEGKRVLLLSPDMGSSASLQEFYGALKTELRKSGPHTIFHENLDISQFPQETYKQNLSKWLKEKYRTQNPDMILVFGQQALRYLLQYEKNLWPGTPVVFALTSDIDVVQMNLPPNFTGKVLRANFSNVVSVAKALFPDAQQLVLIGNAPGPETNKTFLPSRLNGMADKLNVQDLRGQSVEAVKEVLSNLSPDAVVYQGLLRADIATGRSSGSEFLAEVISTSMRPVLVDDPALLGSGPLAALSFAFVEQGRETAELALSILSGKPLRQEILSSGFTPLLDKNQLVRWQVQPEQYPSGSELRFYTPTVWEAYRWQLIFTFALVLVLLIAVVALVIERRLHAHAVDASRQVLGQITQMNRKMTASIYNEAIGHELMQPLAAILSNVEAAQIFLKREPPTLDLVQETLQNIRRDNLRADELIKNMQGLLTKSDTELVPVEVNWLVRKVLHFLSIEAKVRRISIKEKLGADGMIVSLNIVQMQQVLVNLLLNSMDAIDRKKGRERSITVETMLYGSDHVRISILDSGTGFDEGVERVFESFFTTKPEGVGLGLWISASIVQAHGGHIWAENRLNGGIMRFKLPLMRSE